MERWHGVGMATLFWGHGRADLATQLVQELEGDLLRVAMLGARVQTDLTRCFSMGCGMYEPVTVSVCYPPRPRRAGWA